ncbi:MAG: hypothetical protein U0T68_10430 [Ferruginibacter sp.]
MKWSLFAAMYWFVRKEAEQRPIRKEQQIIINQWFILNRGKILADFECIPGALQIMLASVEVKWQLNHTRMSKYP